MGMATPHIGLAQMPTPQTTIFSLMNRHRTKIRPTLSHLTSATLMLIRVPILHRLQAPFMQFNRSCEPRNLTQEHERYATLHVSAVLIQKAQATPFLRVTVIFLLSLKLSPV